MQVSLHLFWYITTQTTEKSNQEPLHNRVVDLMEDSLSKVVVINPCTTMMCISYARYAHSKSLSYPAKDMLISCDLF